MPSGGPSLTPLQYRYSKAETERPFTGEHQLPRDGEYECICCGQPLFDSRTKFDLSADG